MRFRLITLFLFAALVSFSQIQNQEGEVIFQNGDTVTGNIYYYVDTPEELIVYDNNDLKNTFLLNQFNEINLNNGIKYKCINYPTKKSTPALFQKIISSNKINLYSKEYNGGIYFYVSKDNSIYPLENNDVYTKKDDKKYLSKDFKYIGTLKMLMADQPELYEEIDKTKLNEPSLCDIIIDYNKGDISYYYTIDKTKKRTEPNWLLFGQYSQYASYVLNTDVAYSFGILAGTQVNFTRNHRHSFKFNLGYSKYQMADNYNQILDLGVWYQYIFFRTERLNTYVSLNILELSYIKEYDYETDDNTENYFYPVLRFSPGIGLEYKTLKRLSFYAELNNIFYNIAKTSFRQSSFSIGIKYDIGNTTSKHIISKVKN